MYIATYAPSNGLFILQKRRSFSNLQPAYDWLDSLNPGHKAVYYKEYAFTNSSLVNYWHS